MKDEHLRVKNKPKKLSLAVKLKNTWKEYRSTMKDQSSKVETNVFKFKSNKPFKKK